MSTFLLKLLELSFQAGALTLAILLVRLIFRKLPAKYLCLLWAIVAVRLIVPFSIETGFAWAPGFQTLWSVGENKINNIYGVLVKTESREDGDYYLGDSQALSGNVTDVYVKLPGETVTGAEDGNLYIDVVSPTPVREGIANAVFRLDWRELLTSVTPVLFTLWFLGMFILLGYGVFSCVRIKRQVKNAIPYEDNIWLCEGLQTPFLFGWRHPQIYLPTNLEEAQIQYVVEHEKAHIARGDNYAKLIGYVLLAIYWFNPLIWVAYVMFCKDVERACDERVIGDFSAEDRKGYTEALLECSVERKFGISNPLAFGEMDVKKRIMEILRYKKQGKWVIAVAVLLCVTAVAGCFFVKKEDGELTNPPEVTPMAAATATPTVVPDQPTETPVPTPEPTRVVSKLTPTPLPPSDLELLGKVAEGAVTAVPLGQTVEVDLDGDGVEETVTFGMEGYTGDVTLGEIVKDTWSFSEYEHLYYLKINDTIISQEQIRLEYWDDNPNITTYYIFDISSDDKYKEIGLYFDGPSGDPHTALYRYADGIFYCIGGFDSAVTETDGIANRYRKLTYEEMVAQVPRDTFMISVPGDGTILCKERIHFLGTTSIVSEYYFRYPTTRKPTQEEVIRERYEFSYWNNDNGEMNNTAAKDFYAYLSPMDMGVEAQKDVVEVMIPEGTRIAFYSYYPDNEWTAGWVQFAYGEKLDSFAWFYYGVDLQGKSMINLPQETLKDPDELFNNISYAG